MMWAMLSGAFLSSRDAIFPISQKSEFDKEGIRRSWSTLRYGSRTIEKLIEVWRRHVMREGKWQVRH